MHALHETGAISYSRVRALMSDRDGRQITLTNNCILVKTSISNARRWEIVGIVVTDPHQANNLALTGRPGHFSGQ
jgi:hypothetical protein